MAEIRLARLLLRPIEEKDDADIFEYSQSPAVGSNAGWKPHTSIEETQGIMKTIFLDNETVWGFVLKKMDKLIGTVGLIDDPKRQNPAAKMLGYAISDQHWGNGYMTEAVWGVIKHGFEQLGLGLISAYCYPENLRSKRVLEKCGFTYEGTLKQAEKLFNDEVKDNACYVLTSAQYAQAAENLFSALGEQSSILSVGKGI